MVHSHNHQEIPDDILPKLKNYWLSPDIYEFTTAISEIDERWIRLKKNYFYPEGGGQPSDHGVIEASNIGIFNVEQVEDRYGEIWLLLDKHELEEGQDIKAKIDDKRRKKLSTNHSAQHLFSAVLWEELEYETVRAEIGLLETQIDVNKKTSFDDLNIITRKINELIENELPIFSKYYSNPKQITDKLRGKLEGKDIYRLVAIDKYDLNPCGGTHIENTREIGSIFINKLEGKKIRFYTGFDANINYSNYGVDLIQISRLLNVPFNELVYKTKVLVESKNQMEKKIHKLENNLINFHIRNHKYQSIDKLKNKAEYKIVKIESFHKPSILESIGDLDDNQIVIVYDAVGTYLLSTGNINLTNKITNVFKEKGIRGGGKGNVIMGRLNETDKSILEELIISVF